MKRVLSPLFAVTCILLGCGDEPVEPSPAGDPCEVVLGRTGTTECVNAEDECEQALRDDHIGFAWRMELRETSLFEALGGPVSQGERDIWVSCLAKELPEADYVVVDEIGTRAWLRTRTTAAEMTPLLELAVFRNFEVECVDDDYCACRDRDLDSCEEHAFCDLIGGSWMDTEQQCTVYGTAGCGDYESCGDVIVMALEIATEQCWMFYTDCLPGGFAAVHDEEYCPYEMWHWEPCD